MSLPPGLMEAAVHGSLEIFYKKSTLKSSFFANIFSVFLMFFPCEHVYAIQATLRSGLDKKWYMFYMLYDGLSIVPTSMNDDAVFY